MQVAPDVWRTHTRGLFGGDVEIAEYFDEPRGSYRMACFLEGRLVGCLFIGALEAAPQWGTVKTLFEAESVGEA